MVQVGRVRGAVQVGRVRGAVQVGRVRGAVQVGRCGAGREISLAEGKLNLLLTALTAVHLPTRPAVVLRGGVREIEETGSEGEKGRATFLESREKGVAHSMHSVTCLLLIHVPCCSCSCSSSSACCHSVTFCLHSKNTLLPYQYTPSVTISCHILRLNT